MIHAVLYSDNCQTKSLCVATIFDFFKIISYLQASYGDGKELQLPSLKVQNGLDAWTDFKMFLLDIEIM